MITIDSTARDAAIHRFVALAGLTTKAGELLVDAALQAAVNQTLDTMMGSGAVPSALTTARADQLHYVCLQARRPLTQREVGVLFRTIPANARSILTTMTATYEQGLRAEFLTAMRADASVQQLGSANSGFRWRVKFTQQATYQFAVAELERMGLLRSVNIDASACTLEFDQQISTQSGVINIRAKLGV